jgi:hypothetical protein
MKRVFAIWGLFLISCSSTERPACVDLCPAETTGILSNQCPISNAPSKIDIGCVCILRGGTSVPVTNCEVKAAPGEGTYDYLCEDVCH